MKITKIFIGFLLFTICFLLNGCESVELDQTEDPSAVSNAFLDPVYTFNYVQLKLKDFVLSNNSFTQEMTRQMAMTSGNNYNNAFAPVDFNNNWQVGYSILNAVKVMTPKAIEKKEYYALGASKIIGAYVAMTMVDTFGDVPFSEALQAEQNFNPKYDNSALIYKQLFLDLDEAVSILAQSSNGNTTVQDLYYSGNVSNWVKLANTLKLKMLNNARLAGSDIGVSNVGAAMNSIIAGGNIINSSSEDFVFKFGTSRFTPNTRHPLYNNQYELGGGLYICNYMFWTMTIEKSTTAFPNITAVKDPRTNFYFFKQVGDPAASDNFTLPRGLRPDHYNETRYNSFFEPTVRMCYLVSNWLSGTAAPTNGFWGRDHGNNSGIPPDGAKRTVVGLYPIGGKYFGPGVVAGSVQTSGSAGAQGAGILPIMMSSFVHFIKAEAILTAGVSGDAKAELIAGIDDSIDRSTRSIGAEGPQTAVAVAVIDSDQTLYTNYIKNKYDSFTPAQRLELVVKEYLIAAWGNGIEPYNNYRRTGYPSNFQPTLEPVSGSFFSTALYAASSTNNNPNFPVNDRSKKVFWDKLNLDLK